LASIGLIAFAGMAQFSPHFLLAVYGKGRDPIAGRLSLAAGFGLALDAGLAAHPAAKLVGSVRGNAV
jgi:hypothetical protein